MKRFTLLAFFVTAILALGLHGITKGQSILYEDFNYTPPTNIGGNGAAGSSNNNWTTHSVSAGQTTTIDVVSGNLSYPGLAAPSGYMVYDFGNANATSRDVNRAFTSAATVLYFSVLLNLVDNSGITATGDYFMHFGATAGTTVTIFGGRLGAKTVNAGANYRFMIQNTSSGTPTFTEFAQDCNFGTTYIVVVKYDRSASPTMANLWVNPSSLGGAEPAGSVSNNSGTGAFAQFASICIRNNATTPKVNIDEIRVGPAWADVTPTGSVTAPTIQAHDIAFSSISTSGMTATWTNGDGAKRIVIMNTANSFTNPVDGTDPSANTIYSGSGEQVVYNNTGNSVSITGLNASTSYWFRVYEYNGSGSGTKYLTTTATNNPNSQATTAAAVAPSISSPTSVSITNTTAVLGGTITANGGAAITERGTVWKASAGVTITDNKLAEGGTTVGTFSHTRSALPPKTQIFFKAYATNSAGTSLTSEASFFTLANEPTSHVTGFTALPGGTTSINLTWTTAATGADGYLVLMKTGAAAPTGIPIDATGYTVGGVLGDGTVVALVTPGSSLTKTITGLSPTTQYSFTIIPYAWDGANNATYNYYTAPSIPSATATTLCPLPSAAGSVTGPVNVCSPGTGFVYTVPVIANATNYNWTSPPGAIITAGGNTNSITISYPAGSVSGNVSVYGSSNCGNGTASPNLAVTVNVVPVPTITGISTLCVNSGYYDYTTEAGMTGYIWTISPGGTINYGSGTNVISVSWVASGAQWVKVSYTTPGGCTAAIPTVKNITVNPLPAPAGTITGIPSVCAGTSGFHYSVAPIANTIIYLWTLPAGATITSGEETNSIIVSYSSNAVSGNITVQGDNLCGVGTVSAPYPVIVIQIPGEASTITGNNSVCEGDVGIVYTVSPISNATGYEWTVPTGAVIVNGANTNSITVNFPSPSSSGYITVYGTNFCGNGTEGPNLLVTVKPAPPTPVITAVVNTLQSSASSGNQWYFNGTLIPGATEQTYIADQSGDYTCIVTLNGCSSAVSNVINIIITGTGAMNVAGTINVYPNPNDGQFVLLIEGSSAQETTYDLFVVNSLGVKIFELDELKVKGNFRKNIDLRPAPKGIYTIILRNNDQNVLRKIIVNK